MVAIYHNGSMTYPHRDSVNNEAMRDYLREQCLTAIAYVDNKYTATRVVKITSSGYYLVQSKLASITTWEQVTAWTASKDQAKNSAYLYVKKHLLGSAYRSNGW